MPFTTDFGGKCLLDAGRSAAAPAIADRPGRPVICAW
jgi:hypothetical protein